MSVFPADAALGPGELLELVDRELRGPAEDRSQKAVALLERVLAFSKGPEGIAAEAFVSPVAQLHVGAAGVEGRVRLEARLEQLRKGLVPLFDVHPGLLSHLELPANASGWRALREHLAATYGKRYAGDLTLVVPAARLPMRTAGNPFLEEIWAFAHPQGHWHYVTFGLTSLVDGGAAGAKGADGWGFELTVRVAPSGGEIGIPSWPVALLHNLAAYVQNSHNAFDEYHHLSYGRPLSGSLPSALHAVGLALDPELGKATTPYGQMKFLQIVGLTDDEEAFTAEWSVKGLFEALGEVNPLQVVHRERDSALSGAFGESLRARAALEGSSQDISFAQVLELQLEDEQVELVLGPANHGVGLARNLAGIVRGRLGHGRSFALVHPESGQTVRFEPGAPAHRVEAGELVVQFDEGAARAFAARLDAMEGEGALEVMPGLTFDFVDVDD